MNGKKVMVFGMARSGIACAKLLLLRGADVTICDSKAEDAFGDKLNEIKAAGARFLLDEKHPEDHLEGLDELRILENYIPADRIGDQKKLGGNQNE